jgi:hypothetical protein
MLWFCFVKVKKENRGFDVCTTVFSTAHTIQVIGFLCDTFP